MKTDFWLILGKTALLLLALSGCGSGGNTSSSGTTNNNPVSISTDQTSYGPGDSIKVSVTNHLQNSIFAYDTRASCTILGIQMQVNGAWQDSQVARCPLGRPAMLIEIQAGKVYTASISAGYPGLSQSTFPTGSYRLLLAYSTTGKGTPQTPTTTVYSATFTVANGS